MSNITDIKTRVRRMSLADARTLLEDHWRTDGEAMIKESSFSRNEFLVAVAQLMLADEFGGNSKFQDELLAVKQEIFALDTGGQTEWPN